MYPWGQIGEYYFKWYPTLFIFSIAVNILLFAYLVMREGNSVTRYLIAGIVGLIAGFIGTRVISVLFLWKDLEQSSRGFWYMFWRGGYWYGGPIFGLPVGAFCAWLLKLDVRKGLDIAAICLALGQAIGRIGCFAAGCCFGVHTDSVLGMRFPWIRDPDLRNIPLHPVQLYESFLLFALFGFLLWFYRRRAGRGDVIFLYLIFAPLIRLFAELFRGDPRGTVAGGILSLTEFMSILIMIAALAIHLIDSRRKNILP